MVRVPVDVDEFVTTTLTAPAACAGVVAAMCVASVTVKLEALVPPKVTAAPVVVKFVPVIVTDVPPEPGPEFGLTDVTVGARPLTNVNVCGLVDEPPPGLVTTTAWLFPVLAGVIAVMELSELIVTLAAAVPPKVTEVTPVNPVPLIATGVPPAVGPCVGLLDETLGGITNVN